MYADLGESLSSARTLDMAFGHAAVRAPLSTAKPLRLSHYPSPGGRDTIYEASCAFRRSLRSSSISRGAAKPPSPMERFASAASDQRLGSKREFVGAPFRSREHGGRCSGVRHFPVGRHRQFPTVSGKCFARASGKPVHFFHGFDRRGYDGPKYARIAAKTFGHDHSRVLRDADRLSSKRCQRIGPSSYTSLRQRILPTAIQHTIARTLSRQANLLAAFWPAWRRRKLFRAAIRYATQHLLTSTAVPGAFAPRVDRALCFCRRQALRKSAKLIRTLPAALRRAVQRPPRAPQKKKKKKQAGY